MNSDATNNSATNLNDEIEGAANEDGDAQDEAQDVQSIATTSFRRYRRRMQLAIKVLQPVGNIMLMTFGDTRRAGSMC